MEMLLNRIWTLPNPETKIHQVIHKHGLGGRSFLLNTSPDIGNGNVEMYKQRKSFYVVRDDLLNPLINGNKARKIGWLASLAS